MHKVLVFYSLEPFMSASNCIFKRICMWMWNVHFHNLKTKAMPIGQPLETSTASTYRLEINKLVGTKWTVK